MSTMIPSSRRGRPGGSVRPSAWPWRRQAQTTPSVRTLLRLPLFTKLMIANGAIVVAAATASFRAGSSPMPEFPLAVPLIAILSLIAILAGNAGILWLALAPLRKLQGVAARVSAGDLDARVPDTPLADREMRRLVATFNAGLAAAARQRERLRALQVREASANEAERERVALQLHDNVAQALTALRIQARLALASNDSHFREGALGEVIDGIGLIVDDVRNVAARLRPLGLQLLGLGVAMEAHGRNVLGNAGIATTFRTDTMPGLLTPETELVLYRVAEEAFANIVRHAKARSARVSLRRRSHDVMLCIEDDGVGFEPAESDPDEFGLFEMQERVSAVGGRFELRAAPGHGVSIKVTIPISCDDHAR